MRLEELTVSGFRGFNEERRISIGANVVILKGPNGSGKTSFIDAIQWLLLGDIGRMQASVVKKGEDYISNRYASGPPFVAAEFSGTHGAVRISRRGLGKAMQFQVKIGEGPDLIDDEASSWLEEAIGAESAETSAAELLRRHLLQQDEMREFLQADTKERYEFVAKLTDMERLTSLDSQLSSELKSARDAARELETKVEAAKERSSAASGEGLESRQLMEERVSPIDLDGPAARGAALLGLKEEGPREHRQLADALSVRSDQILEALEQLQDLRSRHVLASQEIDEGGADPDRRAALNSTIETLGNEEEAVRKELLDAEEELATARLAADKAQQLAALALEQIEGDCPVCGQKHKHADTRARLARLLEGTPELAEKTATVNRVQSGLAAIVAKLAAARSERSELDLAAQRQADTEKVIAQVEAERAKARKQIEELIGRATTSNEAELETQASARRMEIEGVLADFRRGLEREMGNRRIARRVSALNEQATELRTRLEHFESELAKQRLRIKRAEQVRKTLGNHINAVMSEVANGSTALINEIYRRLDVHPTFQEFGFHTQRHRETGHLRPWVYDRGRHRDGNALHVLSAAQLNSLAICLFLALNLESRSGLHTAILDDPVQSLDDVNLLSLADVLRTVRSQRQVIVSTHDETLAELLTRKLRPLRRGDETIVVTIDRWGEAGPRVRTESRELAGLEPELELLGKNST